MKELCKITTVQKKTGVHNFARFTRTQELRKNKLNQKKLCKAKKNKL